MNMCTKVMMLTMVGMAACAYGAKQGKTLKFRIQRDAKSAMATSREEFEERRAKGITQSELQYPEEKYTFVWEYSEAFKDVKNEVEIKFEQGERLSKEVSIGDLEKRALHRVRPGTGYIKRITINGKPVDDDSIKRLNEKLDKAKEELKVIFMGGRGSEYSMII